MLYYISKNYSLELFEVLGLILCCGRQKVYTSVWKSTLIETMCKNVVIDSYVSREHEPAWLILIIFRNKNLGGDQLLIHISLCLFKIYVYRGVCVHTCIFRCADMETPRQTSGAALFLSFIWERVSPWTWSSLLIGWLASERLGSTCLHWAVLGSWTDLFSWCVEDSPMLRWAMSSARRDIIVCDPNKLEL